jgi:hypothetical protein
MHPFFTQLIHAAAPDLRGHNARAEVARTKFVMRVL